MRSDYLHYFSVIAESGTLSLAAKRLYISQQALSRILQSMEKELNCQLAIRGRKGITLTENGEYLLTMAKKVQNTMDELENHFRALSYESVKGTITFSATDGISQALLPAPFVKFQKQYPNVQLSRREVQSAQDIIEAVKNNSIDLGFFYYIASKEQALYTIPEECEFFFWKKQSLHVFANKDLPIAKYTAVPEKELAEYPIAFAGSEPALGANQIHQLATTLNMKSPVVVPTEMLRYELVKNGLAIVLLTENAYPAQEEIKELPLEREIDLMAGYLVNKSNQNPILPYITKFFH